MTLSKHYSHFPPRLLNTVTTSLRILGLATVNAVKVGKEMILWILDFRAHLSGEDLHALTIPA